MTLIFLCLFIILMVLVARASFKKPGWVIKGCIHVLGGVVGLWIIDLALSLIGIAIPINIFTVVVVGLLGFPGVVALAALQLLGL